jgi:predicted DNA-binding transcriptional regulator YafY
MLVELLLKKRLSLAAYITQHKRDRRSFQRDLQQLRVIGKQSGFAISAMKQGTYVELQTTVTKIRALQRHATQTERLIGDVARAMGQPIAAETGHLAKPAEADDERFYHLAAATMIESEGSNILAISTALKAAWTSKALVTFRYPDREVTGGSRERVVEPHRVLHRSGVYYLVAYDRGRKAWRTFALDRFLSTPVPAGTNNIVRTIPPAYASDDVLGFMKSDQPGMEVTVELSRFVAASATSRRWQAAQQIELLEGGRARIVFTVGDPSEVARWAFGFGQDAKIVAPPAAVRMARDMARTIAAQHETEAPT